MSSTSQPYICTKISTIYSNKKQSSIALMSKEQENTNEEIENIPVEEKRCIPSEAVTALVEL